MAARTRPRNTRLLVVVLVSASLAIITLDYRQGQDGPLAAVGRAVQEVMAPMQKAVTTATRPVGDFFTGLAHLPTLARENQDLKDQLVTAQTEIARFTQQQQQLQTLLDLLGLKQTLSPSGVAAVVIANGVSNFDWSVTIDKGSNDGIQVDQPVVAGTADAPRLVGRIASVTPISSVVQLILDRDWHAAGVLSPSKETGLLSGQGDQDLQMDGIDPGTPVDLTKPEPFNVFTVSYEVNGQRGLYPPGILVGTVSRVFQGTNEIQTSVSVRPAVDFSALEYVLVLGTTKGGG